MTGKAPAATEDTECLGGRSVSWAESTLWRVHQPASPVALGCQRERLGLGLRERRVEGKPAGPALGAVVARARWSGGGTVGKGARGEGRPGCGARLATDAGPGLPPRAPRPLGAAMQGRRRAGLGRPAHLTFSFLLSGQVNNATARVMTNKKTANPYTNGKGPRAALDAELCRVRRGRMGRCRRRAGAGHLGLPRQGTQMPQDRPRAQRAVATSRIITYLLSSEAGPGLEALPVEGR